GNYYNAVSVLLGRFDGTFLPAAIIYTGPESLRSVAGGDFNHDGKLDIATASFFGEVLVMLGGGDGTFKAAATYGGGFDPTSMAVGDFNHHDGNLDIVTASELGVSVFPGRAGGTFG